MYVLSCGTTVQSRGYERKTSDRFVYALLVTNPWLLIVVAQLSRVAITNTTVLDVFFLYQCLSLTVYSLLV